VAITRFKEKPTTFEYADQTVGMRKAKLFEMESIAKLRSEYVKTIGVQLIEIKRDGLEGQGIDAEGDPILLLQLQQHVSELLCCDPSDSTNKWFAADKVEQDQLAKNGVEKDLVSDVPAEFHLTAFAKFTGMYDAQKDAEKKQADEDADNKEAGNDIDPLSEVMDGEKTTISISDAPSAELPNTLDVTVKPSETGITEISPTPLVT